MKSIADILGIEFPVIQGGMARIATGAFAAACSNAGALGVIASGGISCEQLKREIHVCRENTKKPFAINIIVNHPDFEQIAKLVIQEKVSVVITGNGIASQYVKLWKEASILVIPVIGVPVFAKYMERAGAAALIAEGNESGGHIGPLTTMTLIPQVCDNTSLPVIAAGGIADNRQYKAALALGACGVQIGTSLLASEECPIHDNYKNKLIKARSTDVVVTGYSAGDPVRVLKNKMSQTYLQKEREGADKEELDALTMGGLSKAVFDGDMDNGSPMAGLVCGQIKEIKPIRQILEDICFG
ncbi:MAG: nitronate monooxygenase family protein [Lachnoclostridium sp.]|nr:nitronate monooxygenase family protein [Lachnospira sp.]MCM1247298.1 nitronate monooxygenase family protein [Lachnoclostridium sp.]MCM1534400.1 nitronate monooxygenase family protein [Clostridium sp.]